MQSLGDGVNQKGSIVQPERLRFDFSHGGAIDGPTLGRIEAMCSDQLARDLPIYAQDVALADARPINGASFPWAYAPFCVLAELDVAACMTLPCPLLQ